MPVRTLQALLVPTIHVAINKEIAPAPRTAPYLPHNHSHHPLHPSLIKPIVGVKADLVCDFCRIPGNVMDNGEKRVTG